MNNTPYNIDLLIERASPVEAPELAIWALKNSKAFGFLPLCSSEFFENVHEDIEKELLKNFSNHMYDEWLPDFVKTVSSLSYISEDTKKEIFFQALERDLENVFLVMSLENLAIVLSDIIENGCSDINKTLFEEIVSLMDDEQKEVLMGELDLPFALAGEYGNSEAVALICQHLPQMLDDRVNTIARMLSEHKQVLLSLSSALGISLDVDNLHQCNFSKMHYFMLFALPDIQMKVIRTYLPFLNQNHMQLLQDKASYLPGFPPELTSRLEKMILTQALSDGPTQQPLFHRRKI